MLVASKSNIRGNKFKRNGWIGILVSLFLLWSCTEDGLLEPDNNIKLAEELSDYTIFRGDPSDLIPTEEFVIYELSTQLFSDYAEKQRLIKVPKGKYLNATDDGLPDFPDGTMIVKTFYYFNDKRDTTQGKKIVETRLLVKTDSQWTVGTHLWNDEQTSARLITTGHNKTIQWVDEQGIENVMAYHIPSNRECATCHNASNEVIPIGPKLRNLNREVIRSHGNSINQLSYLQDRGVFDALDPSAFSSLPNAHDPSFPLPERARAYLDVNCAHCHKQTGKASNSRLFLEYDLPLDETHIDRKKTRIEVLMSRVYMPQLGTTVVDKEGLKLIKEYLETL